MAANFLKDYKTYPRMVHWFNPILLYKLLNNVVTSAMFGQYADRRLIVAALDTVDPKKHMERATALLPDLSRNGDGPVWFDFVADLGDGFDSTFAVASVLAKKEWKFETETLPRGQLLIMGGDEVYPLANAQTYRNQLWQPYSWAFPDHDQNDDRGVPLFAIPGNHDWYDGLVQFLAYFSREQRTHFGNWRSQQRRSYFAIQLTKTWWLWAVDIQLAEDMDQPQSDYFTMVAESAEMAPGSRIILCSAEPGWLYTDTNTKSWEIVDYAIGIARRSKKNFNIPLLLSGDTHHYSRYESSDGTQFVTSGGAGAFLHPTHQLDAEISVRWRGKKALKLARKGNLPKAEPAVYPSMQISRGLLWRNLWFAITNWDFSILMAFIYFLVGVFVGLRNSPDAYIIISLLMGWGIVGYTTTQENVSILEIYRSWRKSLKNPDAFDGLAIEALWSQFQKALIVIGTSVLHVGAHVLTSISAARFFDTWNKLNIDFQTEWYSVWAWLGALFLEMGAVGFFAGSTIFGLNMLFTCRWLKMNRNDAFSALRIGRFNNFVRLRIQDDEVALFAIGLEDVPHRDDWNENPAYKRGFPDEPRWIPKTPLKPHLIEKIVVSGRAGPASGIAT
ncbi:metallophosphoesterase [Bradyrhizobium roseum]|uniref:metallophosphoesterase n=1 Tax=Bradyrhizobium roseum TaxID=3056648 RepID=UPI0026341A2A|nr:metallophosphoesterase [Bradyrhizobium roseus]WKA26381.1 metallophosphoesterase [Bradyrhizobium roseus]